MTYSTTQQQITSRRSERKVMAAAAIAVLLVAASTVALSARGVDCPSPATTISNTLGAAVQRANEQPGTGYIANPRQ